MDANTQLQDHWTIGSLLRWAAGYFGRHDIDSPRSTGEILLAHALDLERIDLYLRHDQPLTGDELARFKTLARRRVRHEPVAYIVGEKEFWGLPLTVSPHVLIPRPETECLVETVLENILPKDDDTPRQVLELGVGSGAITLALAKERPWNRYVALDRSLSALALARENARRHRLDGRIDFFVGDWLHALNGPSSNFFLIVSNPPYIARADLATLAPEITEYEPVGALDGGPGGFDDIGRILGAAAEFLTPAGHLVMEIGYDQAPAVQAMAEATGGYLPAVVGRDYSGLDRVVHLQRRAL